MSKGGDWQQLKMYFSTQLGRPDKTLLDCSDGLHHIFSILAQKICKKMLITFVQSLGSETDVCPKFGGKTAKNWS